MQIRFEKRDILEKLCSLIIAAYVVTAMAFECTPNTAKYSTVGIYAVFGIGVLFILGRRSVKLGVYAFSIYFLYAYILLMCNAPGASKSMGQTIAYYYLTCAIVCYVAYYVTYCYPKLVYFLAWGIVIGALVLAYRIAQSYGGVTMMLEYASRAGGERRVGGELINENLLGLYMANALLCCILIMSGLKLKGKQSIYVILFALVFLTMGLLSGSKKAIAFMVIGICVLLWFFSRNSTPVKRILLYGAIVLSVALIVIAIRTVPIFSTISMRLDDFFGSLGGDQGLSESDQNRMLMTQYGLEAFLNNPLLGNGTGSSYVLFGVYSHNNYIELLMNYGIIGFSMYYIPYIMLAVSLFRCGINGDKIAAYLVVYIVLQLGLGIGWVNYYERVVQIIGAAAWGYVDHIRDEGAQR